jgi:hypothetical protein
MSKHFNDENVLDILNESTCFISDSSDDCENDITVADAAVDENGEVEEKAKATPTITVALFGRT